MRRAGSTAQGTEMCSVDPTVSRLVATPRRGFKPASTEGVGGGCNGTARKGQVRRFPWGGEHINACVILVPDTSWARQESRSQSATKVGISGKTNRDQAASHHREQYRVRGCQPLLFS